MSARRTLSVVAVVLVAFLVAQLLAWRVNARDEFGDELPTMLRQGLVNYVRRMQPYVSWPREVNVVLGQSVPSHLILQRNEFEKAYAPAIVVITTEQNAIASGILKNGRCDGCMVVHLKEEANNPFFARAEVALTGGDHAAGYQHTFIHILGVWIHVRTRFVWMT